MTRYPLRSTFGREKASLDGIRASLWTSIAASDYEGAGEKYQAAILEQYKLYAEMADRVSARRSTSNAFFLAVNSAVLGAAGALVSKDRIQPLLLVPLAMLILQCGAWFWLLRSYRQLTSAKYRVVGMMEERLPASPYWLAEWKAVGSGKDRSLYWPLTRLEQLTPMAFALAYVVILLVVVLEM